MVDEAHHSEKDKAANDNRPPDGQDGLVETKASARLDAAVLSIARLIGRQMAREDFAVRIAANDNRRVKEADEE